MWYRIFAATPNVPNVQALLAYVSDQKTKIHGLFQHAPDEEWFVLELVFGSGSSVCIERFLANEPGIREELNSWAGYLETLDYSSKAVPLMERTIQAHQMYTLRRPIDHANEVLLDHVCLQACTFLAQSTGGFYHIDGRGFFEADGQVLVEEY